MLPCNIDRLVHLVNFIPRRSKKVRHAILPVWSHFHGTVCIMLKAFLVHGEIRWQSVFMIVNKGRNDTWNGLSQPCVIEARGCCSWLLFCICIDAAQTYWSNPYPQWPWYTCLVSYIAVFWVNLRRPNIPEFTKQRLWDTFSSPSASLKYFIRDDDPDFTMRTYIKQDGMSPLVASATGTTVAGEAGNDGDVLVETIVISWLALVTIIKLVWIPMSMNVAFLVKEAPQDPKPVISMLVLTPKNTSSDTKPSPRLRHCRWDDNVIIVIDWLNPKCNNRVGLGTECYTRERSRVLFFATFGVDDDEWMNEWGHNFVGMNTAQARATRLARV